MKLIRVDDSEGLLQWYREAFVALQQVACRLVAKTWIKKIHPKKVREEAADIYNEILTYVSNRRTHTTARCRGTSQQIRIERNHLTGRWVSAS
jgi:hypothetical protein